jgi:hypothetical protein
MTQRSYQGMFDQICRTNGWILGEDKGEMVLGIPQGDVQVSLVVNEYQDATGQLALRFWCPVAPADKVPADQAMQINSALPHGCLATKDDQVIMTATRILNMTNQAELTVIFQTLAYYADFYGKHYSQ